MSEREFPKSNIDDSVSKKPLPIDISDLSKEFQEVVLAHLSTIDYIDRHKREKDQEGMRRHEKTE